MCTGTGKKTTKGNLTNKKQYVKTQKITRVCPHTKDGAVEVAKYIVEEIKRNVKSRPANNIREYLKEYERRLFHPTFTIVDQGVDPYFTSALIQWVGQVNTGQPWDHKSLISGHRMRDLKSGEKLLGTPPKVALNKFSVHSPIRREDLTSAKSISHYHKYKDYDYFLDVWSNIHYGYVGLSVGFEEDALITGSDIQQLWHNLKKFKFNADTPDDITSMKIGFTLFKKFGKDATNLTYQDVLDILDATPKGQFQKTKLIHWCYDIRNPNRIKLGG